MIATLLSPAEVKALVSDAAPFIELVMDIRKGEWNAEEMSRAADNIDRQILAERHSGKFILDKDYGSLLAILSVMFYAKDKFGHQRNSEEYRALERLYGRLLAALGSGQGAQ